MSSGNVHTKASLILSAGFSIGFFISGNSDLLKCVAGSLVGVFITPDLDLSNGGIVHGNFIGKKIGIFAPKLWRLFWSGYSSSAKHGSWISHFPIFGTFVRLAYIYFWVIFVPHFLIYFLASPNWKLIFVLSWYAKIFLETYFFCGLAVSDTIHYALDKLTKNME